MPEIKILAAAAADRLRLLEAYAFLKRKYIGSQVAIIMYHRVSIKKYDWSLEPLSPRSFERQVSYLSQNYEILSLDRLARDLKQQKSLPKRAVVVTFDDGYRDNYLYAFPILKEHHVPATFFLTTGHIGVGDLFWFDKVRYLLHHTAIGRLDLDNLGSYPLKSPLERRRAGSAIAQKLKRLSDDTKNNLIEKLEDICGVDIPTDLGREHVLSWEEVSEMRQDGAQFGAHSVTHPVLTHLPLEQAEWEIRRSKEDIEKKLREKVNFFSYPDGSFNSEIVRIVKESRFAAAVAADPSWITCRSDPYRLGRIGMIDDPHRSAVLLSGLCRNPQAGR